MLVIISPAKSLREAPSKSAMHSQPDFIEKSERVAKKLKSLSRKKLSSLMSISSTLADQNYQRFQEFTPEHTIENSQPAVLTFDGDVYKGLESENWNTSTQKYAQDHLRILSGLYGLLRPYDLIQPYRLEMGTKINVGRKKNLYEFWKTDVTQRLLDAIEEGGHSILLNLASDEYYKALDSKKIPIPIIKANFKEWRNGEYKFLSYNAKRARGFMTQFVLKNKIETVEQLKSFSEEGYAFNPELSSEQQLIFTKD